jgi:Uma2 family endonuclease
MQPIQGFELTFASRRKRFTVAEVQQLLDAGFLSDRKYELIDGDLIEKMQNPPHAAAIRRTEKLLRQHFGEDRIQSQLPITIVSPKGDYNQPEPDVAVLDCDAGAFETRHPKSTEVALLVRVTDATLKPDSAMRRNLYASAAVREYWVLDLAGNCLVVYRNPVQGVYESVEILKPGDTTVSGGVPVAKLFRAA